MRFVVVANPLPVVEADIEHRLPGRGAWVHPAQKCWNAARKKNAFGRALRSPGITVPEWANLDHGKWLHTMETKQ